MVIWCVKNEEIFAFSERTRITFCWSFGSFKHFDLMITMISMMKVFSVLVSAWWVPLLFTFYGTRVAHVSAAGAYDPCVDQGKVKFKKSFTVGLAYFPDGSIGEWGDLDPCDSADRTALIGKGVAISSFRVNVDEMTLLRTSRQDEDGLMESATSPSATFLSVVAFARGVRSIPRVIRVKSTYPHLLTDFAGKYGRVSSLTLLARFDEGHLEDLVWEDVGCGECGGVNNLKCLYVGINATDSRNAGHACMLQDDSDCECLATASASAGTCSIAAGSTEALKCQTSVSMAFSGTDGNFRVLNTGSSLGDLAKYSASGAFAEALESEL